MKLILIFFLITLEFSLINTSNQFSNKKLSDKVNVVNRKTSGNSERPLMLVGFFNYSKNYSGDGEGPVKYLLTFNVHFINETTFPFYSNLNIPISLNLSNDTNHMVDYNISCDYERIYKETDDLQALSYYCSLNNLNNFSYVKPKIHFIFSNGSTAFNEITEENIDKSSIAVDTINNYKLFYKTALDVRLFIEVKYKVRISFHSQFEPTQHRIRAIYLNRTHLIKVFIRTVVCFINIGLTFAI